MNNSLTCYNINYSIDLSMAPVYVGNLMKHRGWNKLNLSVVQGLDEYLISLGRENICVWRINIPTLSLRYFT
jgi:hypothetical protein